MAILAMYVPQPENLTSSLIALIIAFIVLCGVAYYLKVRLVVAVPIMLIGSVLALIPDLIPIWDSDLGDYGDTAREWSSSNHSDTFFAVTSYMDVGRGKLVAFGGMTVALFVYATINAIMHHRRDRSSVSKNSELFQESSSRQTKHSESLNLRSG